MNVHSMHTMPAKIRLVNLADSEVKVQWSGTLSERDFAKYNNTPTTLKMAFRAIRGKSKLTVHG